MIPIYKVRDYGRNIKVTHCNRLFLVAPAKEDAMPLAGSQSISDEGTAWSALAEPTALEWESEVDEALTRRLTSCILLGVDRWHSMAIAISGPATNLMMVRIW